MAAPYKNPLRDVQGLTPSRIDQGVDYNGQGPVYALGDGTITSVYNSGWPGGAFIGEQLSAGPFAGDYVYEAENITPAVSIGDRVTSETQTGWMTGPVELGWASPPGDGESLARAAGQWTGGNATGYGTHFSNLMQALGAPPGTGGRGKGTPPPTRPGFDWNPLSWPGQIFHATVGAPFDAATAAVGDVGRTLKTAVFVGPILLAAGAIVVFGAFRLTGNTPRNPMGSMSDRAATAAKLAPLAAA